MQKGKIFPSKQLFSLTLQYLFSLKKNTKKQLQKNQPTQKNPKPTTNQLFFPFLPHRVSLEFKCPLSNEIYLSKPIV